MHHHKRLMRCEGQWRLLLAALGLSGTMTVQAAGFALIEQSVAGMGTAYAGAAASADSVGTLYFNPAGMTYLDGSRGAAATHLVLPQSEFHNQGTTFSPAVGAAPIPGGDGGDSGGLAAVPHLYLSHQLDERVWFGLAINAPFGLTTEYASDWVGRYHAIRSAVKTININPSLAFRVNRHLSLGLGVSAMYLDGEFSNAIDFGTINLLPLAAGGLGGALGAVGPGQADGKSVIEGDSWGWGVNVGALINLSADTRLGIHYRSEVDHEIEGEVKFGLPTPALGGIFRNGGVTSEVSLPAAASLSAFHRINPEWAILADYTWTGWSSIPELRFEFDSGLSDAVTTFDWKDTSRVSLGTTYQPSGQNWTYRFGVAYDESPIRNAATRTPRLPDADRIWVAIGAGFAVNHNLKIDIGYAHLFIDDPRINRSGTEVEDITRGALVGRYDSSVDILSLEARYLF